MVICKPINCTQLWSIISKSPSAKILKINCRPAECRQKDYKEALLELEKRKEILIEGKGSRGGFDDKKTIINFMSASKK